MIDEIRALRKALKKLERAYEMNTDEAMVGAYLFYVSATHDLDNDPFIRTCDYLLRFPKLSKRKGNGRQTKTRFSSLSGCGEMMTTTN